MKLSRCSGAILIALTSLAILVPSASAAGSYGLTQEGKPLPTGSILELQSEDVEILSSKTGSQRCRNALFDSKVSLNQPSAFEAGLGGTSSMECFTLSGAPMNVSEVVFSGLKGGRGAATASLSFQTALGGHICKYTASVGFGYQPGSSAIALKPSLLNATPAACGTTQEIVGRFTAFSKGKVVSLN